MCLENKSEAGADTATTATLEAKSFPSSSCRNVQQQPTTTGQKREFLKKKAKYDPRKAIEESKKKADE